MTVSSSFLGTGWSFPPTFQRGSKSVLMVSDEEDIRSSLEVLLTTTIGERVMQPQFGCSLHRLIFAPLDATLRAYVADLVRTAILYFEPRIIVDAVNFEADRADEIEGRLLISIDYTIAGTNTRGNHVFPFDVSEATESA